MKKIKRTLCAAVLVLVFQMACMISFAEESEQLHVNQVYQVLVDTQLRETDSSDAAKLADVTAGSYIIVTAYNGGDWCEVLCEGQKGYLQTAALVYLKDVETLNQEFQNIAKDYENVYEEVLETRKQQSASQIWGGIIIVLIAAIFAAAIGSAVRGSRKDGHRGMS